MKFAELVMLGKPPVWDYSKVDSRTLLNEGAKAHDLLRYVTVALDLQRSLLDKEFKANRLSEAALQLFAKTSDMMRDQRMLVYELEAITSEIGRRIYPNAINRYFGVLKIGELRNDLEAQKEAMRNLYKLFGSIPGKKRWFHPEEWEASDSLTNQLLARELPRHQQADLPTTLEYMMDKRFRYLYRAYECDFKDEIDKLERRTFESPLDPDSIGSVEPRQEHLVIRLQEAALKQERPMHREIILAFAEMLGHSVGMSDRAIRAAVVDQVSRRLGISPQWVRRQLRAAIALREIKQALELDTTEDRIKVVLTDEDEK